MKSRQEVCPKNPSFRYISLSEMIVSPAERGSKRKSRELAETGRGFKWRRKRRRHGIWARRGESHPSLMSRKLRLDKSGSVPVIMIVNDAKTASLSMGVIPKDSAQLEVGEIMRLRRTRPALRISSLPQQSGAFCVTN